jgi:hypothetical protein
MPAAFTGWLDGNFRVGNQTGATAILDPAAFTSTYPQFNLQISLDECDSREPRKDRSEGCEERSCDSDAGRLGISAILLRADGSENV